MRVLVIDTALGACSVGIADNGGVVAGRTEVMARGHSERLGGFVRDTMADAGADFGTIDRIGVTTGPGSFTGLRVGLAFALGLGQALGRPVVGISALQALAWSLDGGPAGSVASIIDARRGEVYVQIFGDGDPLRAPSALTIDAAKADLDAMGRDWRWAGNGAHLLAGSFVTVMTEPTLSALAALTQRLDPERHPPRPLYLRAPDATPPTRMPGQARPAAQAG